MATARALCLLTPPRYPHPHTHTPVTHPHQPLPHTPSRTLTPPLTHPGYTPQVVTPSDDEDWDWVDEGSNACPGCHKYGFASKEVRRRL